MKNRLSIYDWLVIILTVICILSICYMAHTLKKPAEVITDTITVTDTITDWKADTVYLKRYDTIKMPVVIEHSDTVTTVDSILVEIPINTYIFDTTITDTNSEIHFKAVLSGFNVSLDSLYLRTEIMQQQTILTPKIKRWGVGVGVMYGTGGFGVGIGVMYNLF